MTAANMAAAPSSTRGERSTSADKVHGYLSFKSALICEICGLFHFNTLAGIVQKGACFSFDLVV
jgi:hypothetical protein